MYPKGAYTSALWLRDHHISTSVRAAAPSHRHLPCRLCRSVPAQVLLGLSWRLSLCSRSKHRCVTLKPTDCPQFSMSAIGAQTETRVQMKIKVHTVITTAASLQCEQPHTHKLKCFQPIRANMCQVILYERLWFGRDSDCTALQPP